MQDDSSPAPDSFSPDLFVGRDKDLEDLTDWVITSDVPKRLQTIAAPPGYGKSWLLRQLKHRLSSRTDLFFIDIPLQALKSPPDVTAWLTSVIKNAQDVCPEVRSSDPGDSPGAIIHRLLEDLCQNCAPTLHPILIADDFDELLPNKRDFLEKQVLEQFWARRCLKIIITCRDELSLSSHTLRRGEKRKLLAVFTPDIGQKQLQKRAASEKGATLSAKDMLALVPPYQLTHPGINTYLYETAKHNQANGLSPILTADDLRSCWRLPIKKKIGQVSITLKDVENDLKAIINQADSWTLDTFGQALNYSRSLAYSRIQKLLALSLISTKKQRYQVVDGIRELIRAEVDLRKKSQ